MNKRILMSTLVLALAGPANPARAANFSFRGNLSGPDDVQLFTFALSSITTVTLRTWSYAGGVNAAGDTIARGGFDPILALYAGTTASAVKIEENDDGGPSRVSADITGAHFDTWLQAVLNPGTYTVAVSQFAAYSSGLTLGDGFGPSGFSTFRDVTDSERTSAWAFDVLDVEAAAVVPPAHGVPDGGSGLLLLSIAISSCMAIKRMSRTAPAVLKG